MAKTTFTLEEILQEYGPKEENPAAQESLRPLPSGKLETEKLLSGHTAAQSASVRRQPVPRKEPVSHAAVPKPEAQKPLQTTIQNIRRRKESRPSLPEDSAISKLYQQQETPRGEVSFVQSQAMRARGEQDAEEESYDGAVMLHAEGGAEPETIHQPNIRKAPSTRKSRRTSQKKQPKAGASALKKADAPKKQMASASKTRPEPEPEPVHVPNQKDEILENLHALRSVVFFRTGLLLLLSILGCVLAFCETPGNALYQFLIRSLSTVGYCFLELGMAVLAAGVAFPTLRNGLRNLLRGKADCDSMAVLPMLTSVIAAVAACFTPELLTTQAIHLYLPAAILALFFNCVGKLLILRRASRNYGILSKSFQKYVLTYVHTEDHAEQLTRGVISDLPILATVRKANRLSDFLRYTYSRDAADRFCRAATPLLAVASLGIAVGLTALQNGMHWQAQTISICLSLFAALITISCCMGAALVVNLPLDRVTKRAVIRNRVLLSDQSVDDYYDTNALLLNAHLLFPKGSVQIGGIKLFASAKMDEVLLYAASLLQHGGSILQDALETLVPNRKSLYPVEDYQYEDSLGMCGWIQNRRVLVGNREMMTAHNIGGLPTHAREEELEQESGEVLYVSVSGNLAAMLQVKLQADVTVKKWMQELKRERVALLLSCSDSCLSLQKLSDLFQVPEESFKILPSSLQEIVREETAEKDCESATMICDGSFAGICELLVGAKKVRRASVMGLVLQAVTAVLGLGLGFVHLAVGSYATLTAQLYILYQLICTAVTVFAVRRIR